MWVGTGVETSVGLGLGGWILFERNVVCKYNTQCPVFRGLLGTPTTKNVCSYRYNPSIDGKETVLSLYGGVWSKGCHV